MHPAHATVSVNASSLSSARIWTSGVAWTPCFLFLLTAREDYACAEMPAVPELDLTTGSTVIAPVSLLVCPVVKTGASPGSEMATKPVALRLF